MATAHQARHLEHSSGDGHARSTASPDGRERIVETLAAGAFVAVAAGMAFLASSPRPLDLPALGLLVALYLVTCRAKFDIADGYTVPTELVLVPMLFLLPTPLVPLVVGICWTLDRAIDYALGAIGIGRPLLALADCWHSVGPALVLIAAGAQVFSWSDWPVYALALVSLFLLDFLIGATRVGRLDGGAIATQLRPLARAYALDASLAPIGLLCAYAATETSVAICLLVMPLALALAILSRERPARIEQALELSHAYQGTALLLGDVVEADDAYTGSHSRGVVQLSVAVSDELALDYRQRRNVELAALLHDVGKIAVPKQIINKPGPLDAIEWGIMRRHTIEGEEMLKQVGGALAEVGGAVRSSHERYDGNGYPDGLAGEEIPIEARIVSCCDAFSAMTTPRSYGEAMSFAAAVAELRACAGTQFDPVVADALLRVVES